MYMNDLSNNDLSNNDSSNNDSIIPYLKHTPLIVQDILFILLFINNDMTI